MTTKSIFLRHESGSTNLFGGRKLAKLLSELKAGRGMTEIVQLQMNGYTETLGGLDVSSLEYEALLAESNGVFANV